METLLPLTPEQFARAQVRLLHPAAGSRIEAAMRLTPGERAKKLETATITPGKVRGVARRRPDAI
jgi:hypothetical protein